jgi:hypothetical protein
MYKRFTGDRAPWVAYSEYPTEFTPTTALNAEQLVELIKFYKEEGLPRNVVDAHKRLRKMQNYVKQMSPNDAPTQYLKKAYQRFIDTVEDTADKTAIDKALGEAMDAKVRYNAERISRTEIARAHNEDGGGEAEGAGRFDKR